MPNKKKQTHKKELDQQGAAEKDKDVTLAVATTGDRDYRCEVETQQRKSEWSGFNDNPPLTTATAMLRLQQPHQVAPVLHEDPGYNDVYHDKVAEIKSTASIMGQKLLVQSSLPLALSPKYLQVAIAGVKRERLDLRSPSETPAKRPRQKLTPLGLDQHPLQYESPYNPDSSCSLRLQTTDTYSPSNNSLGGLVHSEATAVYATEDALPSLISSSGSTSLSTPTSIYSRYEVVPSSYAKSHAIWSSWSSRSKVLTDDLPSPDSGIGADADIDVAELSDVDVAKLS